MGQTTKDLADILSKRNTDGKYNSIIERASKNGYHDYKFENIQDHPEYGDCICPKIKLVEDLSHFPELSDIRKEVIDGKYDEETDDEDALQIRMDLLRGKAPDAMFSIMGFEIPTKEERVFFNQKNIVSAPSEESHNFIIGIMIKGELKELRFISNIQVDETEAVIQNWIPRTQEYTSQSLVDYINSKSAYGFHAEVLK